MSSTLDKSNTCNKTQPCKDLDKTCAKDKTPANIMDKLEDLWNTDLLYPLAGLIVYLSSLRLVVKETQQGTDKGLPIVFMDCSIYVPIVASVMYLSFIFFGRRYMATREAMNLRSFIIIYNLYQALLNIWAVGSFIQCLYVNSMSIWGNPADYTPQGYDVAFLIWIHYNNKYVELLDTAFMVLRKKNKQISFLHVYHHILLFWSWFFVCRMTCGGDAYFGAMVNSFIHVVMYTYYLVTLLGFKVPKPIKASITKLQMAQFVACLLHALYCLYNQHVTVVLPLLQLWVMVNMLILFGNFYRQAYLKKRNNKVATAPAAESTTENKKLD